MGNHPDQFEDLTLKKNGPKEEGIQGGLVIKGKGTFNFHIEDNEGAVYHIRIANSKNVPSLEICLQFPQHWVQEAQDKYPLPRETRIEDNDEALLLIWNQGRHKRTIPHSPLTNTPIFRMAPAAHTYRTFLAHCKAAEAQYYCQDYVLQVSGQLQIDNNFVAEENVHADIQKKAPLFSDGVTSNKAMVEASNLSSEQEREAVTQPTRMGPLIFDLNPHLDKEEHVYLSAADDQAELMQWHYHLDHLSFSKLKQLALNGKIL
jgi:hypothetical protein